MNKHLIVTKFLFLISIFLTTGILYTGSFWVAITPSDKSISQIKDIASLNFEDNNQRFAYSQNIDIDYSSFDVLGETSEHALSVPVLLYHGILQNSDGENIDIKTFKEHMISLKKAGYQTISIKDFYDFIKGKKRIPLKSFLLTFDDGRKDSYYSVDPILEKLDYKAVMFVITDRSKKGKSTFYLNEEELLKMQKSGRWDIQSHGKQDHDLYKTSPNSEKKAHFLSNLLWLEDENRLETVDEFKDRIERDLISSKLELENITGEEVVSFAYPFGDYGQYSINFSESKNIVPKIVGNIYPLSFYQTWLGEVIRNYPDNKQTLFKRISVKPSWNGDTLLTILENSMDKNLPYFDKFEKNKGWKANWGSVDVKDGNLIISAKPDTMGALAILDGTFAMDNVFVQAKAKSVNSSSVSLWVRINDQGDSIRCVFGNKFTSYKVFKDNVEIKNLSVRRDTVLSEKIFGMKIKDNSVACLINNVVVIDKKIHTQIPANGSIGLSIWTDKDEPASMVIENVQIKEP